MIRYFTPASSEATRRALEAGEHVEGDGDQFERDEEQGEVVGGGGEQHARAARTGSARRYSAMPACDAVGELDGHEQDEEGGQQEEALEEERQAVQGVHLAEGVLRLSPGPSADASEAVEQDDAHAQRRRRSPSLRLARRRQPQVDQQHPQAEGQHQRFVTEQMRGSSVGVSRSRATVVSGSGCGWRAADVGAGLGDCERQRCLLATLGLILSVSRRGKQPKTSSAASSRTNGSLRQRWGASATRGPFSGSGPCSIARTARSM